MTISSHLIGCLDISDYMECVGINVEVLYLNSKYTVRRRSTSSGTGTGFVTFVFI